MRMRRERLEFRYISKKCVGFYARSFYIFKTKSSQFPCYVFWRLEEIKDSLHPYHSNDDSNRQIPGNTRTPNSNSTFNITHQLFFSLFLGVT